MSSLADGLDLDVQDLIYVEVEADLLFDVDQATGALEFVEDDRALDGPTLDQAELDPTGLPGIHEEVVNLFTARCLGTLCYGAIPL